MTLFSSQAIYQFTGEQLKQLIDEVKATVIQEMNRKQSLDKVLTKQEAAAYLRIHVTTLDERFRERKLPTSLRHYNGGSLYFYQSELENFIKRS